MKLRIVNLSFDLNEFEEVLQVVGENTWMSCTVVIRTADTCMQAFIIPSDLHLYFVLIGSY